MDELHKLVKKSSIFILLSGIICGFPQAVRMLAAELVINKAVIVPLPLRIEAQIFGLTQPIFHSLPVESPEFVGEAQIDVVLKPSLDCPEMLSSESLLQ